MFFPDITGWDLIIFLIVLVLVGGFIFYVAIPWLWVMFIKPGLLWILLTL